MNKEHRVLSAGILFADVGCDPIDRCPGAGDVIQTDKVALSLGGCASNVSLNLARLGISTGICGCVGDDAFSNYILDSLEHPLIDLGGVRKVPGMSPGCTLIINVKNEDRRFVTTTGANAEFSVTEIPSAWAEEAEVLYLGGYLMMPLLENEATAEFFKKFRARGGKVILDVVLYGRRPYWEVIKPLLPHVDYFMPNNDEGRLICGLSDPLDQAKYFQEAGAAVSVITCGEKGSVYYSADEKFKTGIYPVDFIGGTGSGDAFAAGFISGVLNGDRPEDLVRRASAQGMSCVRHRSATESVFTKEELDSYLAGHDLEIIPIS